MYATSQIYLSTIPMNGNLIEEMEMQHNISEYYLLFLDIFHSYAKNNLFCLLMPHILKPSSNIEFWQRSSLVSLVHKQFKYLTSHIYLSKIPMNGNMVKEMEMQHYISEYYLIFLDIFCSYAKNNLFCLLLPHILKPSNNIEFWQRYSLVSLVHK